MEEVIIAMTAVRRQVWVRWSWVAMHPTCIALPITQPDLKTICAIPIQDDGTAIQDSPIAIQSSGRALRQQTPCGIRAPESRV